MSDIVKEDLKVLFPIGCQGNKLPTWLQYTNEFAHRHQWLRKMFNHGFRKDDIESPISKWKSPFCSVQKHKIVVFKALTCIMSSVSCDHSESSCSKCLGDFASTASIVKDQHSGRQRKLLLKKSCQFEWVTGDWPHGRVVMNLKVGHKGKANRPQKAWAPSSPTSGDETRKITEIHCHAWQDTEHKSGDRAHPECQSD